MARLYWTFGETLIRSLYGSVPVSRKSVLFMPFGLLLQSFCQYRAKMKNKTEQEIALLRQHDQAWNVYGVLNFLQALMEKSSIIQILEPEKEGLEQFTATDGYDYSGGSNVLKVLGYFSMVDLLRVHCLLGDYQTGLKCLLPIDTSQQGVCTSVIGSHVITI